MFSFLNTGILFFLAAGVLPLLIYLFAKKKPKKVIFSSIRFISESSNSQRKRINLKNILLLIIRTLIILLTILAISRPFVKLPGLSNTSKHPATAIAIILDTSWSMDYLSEQTTSLSKGLEIVEQINSMTGSQDVISLITTSKEWNEQYAVNHQSKLPEKRFKSISTVVNPIPLSESISIAEQLLREAQLSNREIYLVTDLQKQELPENCEFPLMVIPVNPVSWYNVSCTNAKLDSRLINKDIQRTIEFKVENHSEIERKDVLCKLVLNDKTIAEKFINLSAFQTKSEFFKVNLISDGWYNGFVEVQDETLLIDNRSYFSFPYKSNPKIGYVSDLETIPPVLKSMLEIFSGKKNQDYSLDLNSVNTSDLKAYDFLVIYGKKHLSTKEETLLERYNDSGNGVLFCLSEHDSDLIWEFYNSKFGIKQVAFIKDKKKISYSNKFHNITSLSSQESLGDIDIRDFWQIAHGDKITPIISASGSPVILNPQPNWLLMFDVGSMRNTFFLDSNWPVLSYRIFLNLSNIDRNSYSFDTGSNIRADRIILPDNSELTPSSGYYLSNRPGILQTQLKERSSTIAINLDNSESSYSEAEFDSIQNSEILDNNWKQNIFRARYGFEIWKILLVIVLFLFIFEMLLVKHEERKLN